MGVVVGMSNGDWTEVGVKRQRKNMNVNIDGFMTNFKRPGTETPHSAGAGRQGETPLPLDIAALFTLGLFGTGHCLGMCGPLVVALPGQTGRWSSHLVYHAGRLATYTLIGAAMGGAGRSLMALAQASGDDPMIWMSRVQMGIGGVAALVLVVLGLARLGLIAEPGWMSTVALHRVPGVRRRLSAETGHRRNADLLVMGLILGGLPCGLSYAAFAKSLAGAQVMGGALSALAFGLGTVPGLLAVGGFAGRLFSRYRQQSDILSGLIMIGMAARLFIRGLEMGMG
jgi:sulfite exporter TauE/SafE